MVKFVMEENPNRQTGNTVGTDNHEKNYRSNIRTAIFFFIQVTWTMAKTVGSYSKEFVTGMIMKEAKSQNLTLSDQPLDSNITKETSDFKLSANQECTDRSEGIYINALTIPCRDFRRTEASWLNKDVLLLNPSETKSLKTVTPDESEIHLKSLAYYKVHGCSKEELNEICRSEENFKGWLTKDEIKSGLEEGSYLIENQVPGDKLKHCTALRVERNHYEYFDSNGGTFTENIGIHVNSNQTRFQHPYCNTCGLHATYFIKQRHKLGSLKKVQDSYPTDKAEMLQLNEDHADKAEMLQLNEDHVYKYTKERADAHKAIRPHSS